MVKLLTSFRAQVGRGVPRVVPVRRIRSAARRLQEGVCRLLRCPVLVKSTPSVVILIVACPSFRPLRHRWARKSFLMVTTSFPRKHPDIKLVRRCYVMTLTKLVRCLRFRRIQSWLYVTWKSYISRFRAAACSLGLVISSFTTVIMPSTPSNFP